MTDQALGKKSLISYSLPSAPLSMLGFMLAVYIPPFYAQTLGMDLAAIGGVFFLARLWDAIIDPVIGNLSDKTKSKFGRRKPWMLLGTPILLVTFYLFCFPPEGIGVRYLAVVTFCFYIAFTLVQIPYLSWGAELSRNYKERMRITGYRESATMMGVILAVSIPLFFLAGRNPTVQDIVQVFATAILILIPITVLVAIFRAPQGQIAKGVEVPGLWKSLNVARRNKPFMRILIAMFLIWIGGGIYNSTSFFLVQKGLAFTPLNFLQFMLIQYGVGLALLPLHVKIGGKIGKHRALLFVGMSFFLILPMFYLVQAGNFWQAAIVFALKGAVTASIWIMPPALVADAIENGILEGGGDDAALYMSLYFFIQKAAMAIGVGIGLPMIAYFGFDPATFALGNDIGGLKFVSLVLSGLIALPAVFILFSHPIDEKEHARIRSELRDRGVTEI